MGRLSDLHVCRLWWLRFSGGVDGALGLEPQSEDWRAEVCGGWQVCGGWLGFPILNKISPPTPQPTQAGGKPLEQGCAEAFAQQLSRDPGPKSLGGI